MHLAPQDKRGTPRGCPNDQAVYWGVGSRSAQCSYDQESALYFRADVAPEEVWLIAGVLFGSLGFFRDGFRSFPAWL